MTEEKGYFRMSKKIYVTDVVTGDKVFRDDCFEIHNDVIGKVMTGTAFISRESADISGYHRAEERETSKQAENAEKIRWGIEFECKFERARTPAVMASLFKKGSAWNRAEKDCSLHETDKIAAMEAHLTGNNLRRVDKNLETALRLTFLDEDCGTHFNLSFPDWDPDDYVRIAGNADWIFSDLLAHLLKNEDETVERCGRYFSHYADNTGDYAEHCNWLNLTHCYERDDDKRRFEWRLAKCTSIRQYVKLMQAITAVFKAVKKWFLLGYPKRSKATISRNVLKAWESAWEKLDKVDEKYGRV